MTDEHVLEELNAAYRDLRQRRFAQVIGRIEALPDSGGELGIALGQVARGLTLEADGRPAEATEHMERALDSGVALPELLLELARYFKRSGRQALAHHAFLMRDLHLPGTMPGFMRDLPDDERARYTPLAVRRSMTASSPDFYGLADEKAALAQRLGPEGAAVVLASIGIPGKARKAAARPLRRLGDYAREHGFEYDEVIPAADVRARWPHVFEQADEESYTARARPLFSARLDGVVVSGKSNVLLTSDEALLDVQEDEQARIPLDLRVDPIVSAVDGDRVVTSEPADIAALRHIPEAIWLSGVHSGAFGHWIIEFLPKIWAFMERWGRADMPVLVDRQMPRQHVEALRFFVDRVHPIVLQPAEQVHVERLWVASQLVYMPVGPLAGVLAERGDAVIDADRVVRLLERYQAKLDAIDTSGRPGRIYLARDPRGRRKLLNAAAVETEVERRGYRIVRSETLGFHEQLSLIRSADSVVGPDGSAFMMNLFGRPGLKIGILSHPYLEEFEWYTQASDALDQRLTVITGQVVNEDPTYRTFSDYEIDLAQLVRYLDSVEDASPPPGGTR